MDNNQLSISPTIVLTLTDLITSNTIKEFNSLQNSIKLGRGAKSNELCKLKSNGLFRLDSNRTSTKVMSQKHALISWDKACVFLTDLNSTNGTSIKRDGEITHLISDVAYRLKTRDIVTFGKQTGGNGGDSQQNYPISLRVNITTTYSRPVTSQVATTTHMRAADARSLSRLFEPSKREKQKRPTGHSLPQKKKKGYGLSEKELISPEPNTENDVVILDEESSEDEKKKIFMSKSKHRSVQNLEMEISSASEDEEEGTQVVIPRVLVKRKEYAHTQLEDFETDDERIEQAEIEVDRQVVSDHDLFESEEQDDIAACGMEIQDETEFIGGLHMKSSPTKMKVIQPPTSPIPSQETQWIKSQELESDNQQIQEIQDFLAEESLSVLDPFSDSYAVRKSRKNEFLSESVKAAPILLPFSSSLSSIKSSPSQSKSDLENHSINSNRGFDTRSSKVSLAFKKAVKPTLAQPTFLFEEDDDDDQEAEEAEAVADLSISGPLAAGKIEATAEMEMEPSRQNSRTIEIESDSEEVDYSSIEFQPAQVHQSSKRPCSVRFHFDSPTSNSSRLPSPVSPAQQESSRSTMELLSDEEEDDIDNDRISQHKSTRGSGKSIKVILAEVKKKESSDNHLPSPSPELGVDVVNHLSLEDIIELEAAETERDDIDDGHYFEERLEVDEPDEVDLDDEVFDLIDTFEPSLTSNFHHPFNTNAGQMRSNYSRRSQVYEEDSENEEEQDVEENASPVVDGSDDQESQDDREQSGRSNYPALTLRSGSFFDIPAEEQDDTISLEDEDDHAEESQEEEEEGEEEEEDDEEEEENDEEEEEDEEGEEESEVESILEIDEDEVSGGESESEFGKVKQAEVPALIEGPSFDEDKDTEYKSDLQEFNEFKLPQIEKKASQKQDQVDEIGILGLVSGPLLETEDEEDDTYSMAEVEFDDSQVEEDEERGSPDTTLGSEFFVAPNGVRLILDVTNPTQTYSEDEVASTSNNNSAPSEVEIQSKQEPTNPSSVSSTLHRYFKPSVRKGIVSDKQHESIAANIQVSPPRTSFKRDHTDLEEDLSTAIFKLNSAIESAITSAKLQEDVPVIKKRRINIPSLAIGSTIGFISGVVATIAGLNAFETYLENV